MRIKACAIAIVLILLVVSFIPLPVHGLSFSINPMSGPVGTNVAISSICNYGTGDYYIYWGETQELISQGSAEGCPAVYFTIPDAPRGKHKVTLKIGGKVYENNFTVTPSFEMDTYAGYVGAPVIVFGKGFNTNESGIRVTFNKEVVLSDVIADRKGNWQGSFKVPAGRAGSHTVDAFGVTPADDVPDLAFTINAKIDINPSSGGVGTTVTVEGNGFAAGETSISILYDNVVQKTAIAANSVGFWRSSFNVPPSTRGVHTVDAFGSITPPGTVTSAPFTISPAVKLEMSSGYVGSPVHIGDSLWVSGIGFEENESGIQVTFDGVMVSSGITADAKGSWAVQFDVPLSGHGQHIISAAGGSTRVEDVSSAIMLVSPSVTVMPDAGNAGQEVSVKGMGFGVSQGIIISFDGDKVSTGVVTDSRGTFTADFRVPKVRGGEHSIICTDAAGGVASTVFTMETEAPQAPKLIVPEPGARLSSSWGSAVVAFHWEAVEDPSGVSYIFEISRNHDFSGIVLRKEALSANEYTLDRDEALENGEYYWRVKAIDGAYNESPWTAGQEFTIRGFTLNFMTIAIIVGVIIVALIVWRIVAITRKRK